MIKENIPGKFNFVKSWRTNSTTWKCEKKAAYSKRVIWIVNLRDLYNKLRSYVQFSPLSQVQWSLFLPEVRVESGRIFRTKENRGRKSCWSSTWDLIKRDLISWTNWKKDKKSKDCCKADDNVYFSAEIMFKKAINTHCHQACNSLWTVHFPITEFTKKATLHNMPL